jgi:hypothetical protein
MHDLMKGKSSTNLLFYSVFLRYIYFVYYFFVCYISIFDIHFLFCIYFRHYEQYYTTNPSQQQYPIEEFRSHGKYISSLEKPRFEIKKIEQRVEVDRRNNISRQYNRNK